VLEARLAADLPLVIQEEIHRSVVRVLPLSQPVVAVVVVHMVAAIQEVRAVEINWQWDHLVLE
jgi:hypothetical protein